MANDTTHKTNAPPPGEDETTPIDKAADAQATEEEIDESEFADFVEQELGASEGSKPKEKSSRWKRKSKASSAEVEDLRKQLDEAIASRQRAQADFANFQRRSRGNETQAGRDGMIAVIRTLMPVIDNVDLALSQDASAMTVDQMRDGVKILRTELMKALQLHMVKPIRPEPGDEFDPEQHHAVMQLPTDEFPENHVVNVLQVGFILEEQVLRPATVVVAAPPEAGTAPAPVAEAPVDEGDEPGIDDACDAPDDETAEG